MNSATAFSAPPSSRSLFQNRSPAFWITVAMLGSLLAHVALWFWFQQVYLPHTMLPSKEKLLLRKFNFDRVEIPSAWLEPKLPAPDDVSSTPSPDRSALTPSEEKRSFAQMLSQASSSPTMPAGSPQIPRDKPQLALAEDGLAPAEIFSRSKLDAELSAEIEQQFQKTSKGASAGRPILNVPGQPVVPKKGSSDLGPPTHSTVGPSQGPDADGSGKFTGSSRLEDFFGAPGGLPPPAQTPVQETKPKPVDASTQVPQGLIKDKPKTTQEFDSLNRFLNVELFTQERASSKGKIEGYFLIRITAKPNPQLRVIPKDVFFVLDISSSIGTDRLEVFKTSVRSALPLLNPQDRFKIMVFRDKLISFRQEWLPSENPPMTEIQTWFEKLSSAGVTDLYDSLRPLTASRRQRGRMTMALVMSDGVPTKGIIDSTQIINELSAANQNKVSIFTLSSGTDVNNFLLDLLSYRNQGWLRYSADVSQSTEKFHNLAQQVRNPLFLNLRFRFAGVEGDQVYPQNLPNLYQDSPLLLFGRYTPGQSKPISLQVLGESFEKTRELLVQLPIPEKPTGPATIAPTWARQRIYHLLGSMTGSRVRQDKILDEIRPISEEYKIEAPYF